MNFFDVLFWMGMLCFIPIGVIVVRDALQAAPSLPQIRKDLDDATRKEPVRATV